MRDTLTPEGKWADGYGPPAKCIGKPCEPGCPGPCYSWGPDWRIITNGRRYRVQRRILGVWDDVMDVYIWDFNGYSYPFETRFLWRAKRRLRREMAKAERCEQEEQWRVVEQ